MCSKDEGDIHKILLLSQAVDDRVEMVVEEEQRRRFNNQLYRWIGFHALAREIKTVPWEPGSRLQAPASRLVRLDGANLGPGGGNCLELFNANQIGQINTDELSPFSRSYHNHTRTRLLEFATRHSVCLLICQRHMRKTIRGEPSPPGTTYW